jgi:hypothetical protein
MTEWMKPTISGADTASLAPTIVKQRQPKPVPLPHVWNVGDELPHNDYLGPPSFPRGELVPQVGMGVTMGCGSDSYPGTIVKVAPNARTIWVVYDDYKYVGPPTEYGDPGKDDDWVYTFRASVGSESTLRDDGRPYTLRKDGRYHYAGQALKARNYVALGHRHYHYDPHF